jgi:hypothetical protein
VSSVPSFPMEVRMRILTWSLVFMLLLSALARAQTVDWGAVMNLPAGTIVRLQGPRHGRIQGAFRSADEVQIVLDEDGRPGDPFAISRQAIQRVERCEPTADRKRGAKKGFWIGLAIGTLGAAGAGLDRPGKECLSIATVFTATGTLLGAATASPKCVLVYRRNGS